MSLPAATGLFRFRFGIFVLMLACGPAARATPPAWVEVRSPHFSVYTDAGEKRGREVAVRFEEMRVAFGKLMDKGTVNLPVPLQVVAFRTTKELRQFAPLWNGKPIEMAGLFVGGQDRTFIMLDLSVENPWEVVFHEYAHQLMNGNLGAEVDPWFEEGFAEYFASVEVDSNETRIGKLSAHTVRMLANSSFMKVADLFQVRHDSKAYNQSGHTRTLFYAQSALTVHYLFEHKLISNVGSYFNLLRGSDNLTVEQAIQKAFGITPDEFDKRIYAYFRAGHYTYYRIPTSGAVKGSSFTAGPVTENDAAALKADIHLHSPDYQAQAVSEFQEILKQDPENAAACRGLGYAYLRKHDFDTAGSYFDRAAKANSQDPRVHYYSAIMMSREGQFSESSRLTEIIQELQTAIALDPSFADPYSLLGMAQLHAGEPQKALETMRKAVQLSPGNEIYRLDLARLCLANMRTDEATSLLNTLLKASNPMVVTRASDMLSLIRRGDLDHHEDVIRRQREATTRPSRPVSPESTSPVLVGSEVVETPPEEMPSVTTPPPQASGPIRFLKGIITAVDCSRKPMAILTVVSGTKTWKMRVTDVDHALLMGTDKLSCEWNKQKVALNYRQSGESTGNVVSVEVQ